MSNYRRVFIPGGTFFFTLVTYNRQPLFSDPENVSRLRRAIAQVKSEMPFDIVGAVVLPDHLHFLWKLPARDRSYSKRVGRLKVLFTRSLRGERALPQNVSISRHKHRESNVWQRRFWEHTIQDEEDFEAHLNYIHYNPVKHGLVSCPHFWSSSSFHSWVRTEGYDSQWCCVCGGKQPPIPNFDAIADRVAE
jgi:putative transposase